MGKAVDSSHFPSFLGSVCLHLGVLLLVLFWPAFEHVEPNVPGKMIAGIVTIGKGGTPKGTTPGNGAPEAAPKQEQPKESEAVQPLNKAAEQPQTTPPPDTEAIPIKKEPTDPPKEEPKEVPKEKPKEEPKEIPKDKPKEKPVKPEKEKPKQNATKPPKANVDDTIEALRKQAAGSGGKGEDVNAALAALSQELGGQADGDGDGGLGGGDGVGILGAYEDSVVSRIRPNWSRPERADRKQYTALVNIKISPTGEITDSRVVRSSGDQVFDASVLRAVRATRTLEAPPTPEAMDMDIYFNSDMLAQ